MKSTSPRPVIRVTPTKAERYSSPSPDIRTLDTMMAIVNSANRVRDRVAGLEARLKYLESLPESRGGR
jgi:hypothetical protein